jgi:hypothetical protein
MTGRPYGSYFKAISIMGIKGSIRMYQIIQVIAGKNNHQYHSTFNTLVSWFFHYCSSSTINFQLSLYLSKSDKSYAQ